MVRFPLHAHSPVIKSLCLSASRSAVGIPIPTRGRDPDPACASTMARSGHHLCVVVRTYSRQQRAFTAFIASLLAAREGCDGNVSLSVDVFPTDANEQLSEATLAHITSLRDTPALRPLSLHPHKQATSDALSKQWEEACGRRALLYDFGYLQSDAVLRRVLARQGRGNGECSYVLVTNGDNLYANSLFDLTCPHMNRGTGLISWWFSSHNAGIGAWGRVAKAQGRIAHTGANVLFHTRLQKSWVDLGAVMIRSDLLRSRPRGRVFTDCGPWREADGRCIDRLVRTPNASQVVLESLLFFHQ